MKKVRRILSLVLTLIMCMAMATPALAVANDPEAGIIKKTYHLGNDITITVISAPNEISPLPLANSDAVVNAIASPSATHRFTLLKGEGSKCTANIWNDSKDTEMDVTFKATVNGGSETISDRVAPNRNTIFTITHDKGEDLVGTAVTTIKAVDASSVRYTYTIQQS